MARMTQGSSTSLKHMWDTRPHRIPKDEGGRAVIAGVCTGFGQRYNVDPVAVRIAFVILSLVFGGGIFAYLLCWFFMPRVGMNITPAKAIVTPKEQLTPHEIEERKPGWWLLLGLIIFLPAAGQAADLRGTLLSFAAFFFVWFFTYARTPEPPAGTNGDDLVYR
ncbi:PspC domain protein [Corynebacterium fournieri]|nr:PspC domain protein [Corynebacterium fournieri]